MICYRGRLNDVDVHVQRGLQRAKRELNDVRVHHVVRCMLIPSLPKRGRK